jgi:hypothetical protein
VCRATLGELVGWMYFAIISSATLMCSIPAEADYLLNCRLMDSDTPSWWRKGCKWETIITECEPNELCKVKRLNIESMSAKAALSANLTLRTAALANSATAENRWSGSDNEQPRYRCDEPDNCRRKYAIGCRWRNGEYFKRSGFRGNSRS